VQSSVVTASHVPRPAGEVIVIGVGKAVMNELPFMHLSMAEVSGMLQKITRKTSH
jgi:L-iditol 2-dehydrogenase